MYRKYTPVVLLLNAGNFESENKYVKRSKQYNSRVTSFAFITYLLPCSYNNVVMPQRQSQFTPKMKANAESRLLSSLV